MPPHSYKKPLGRSISTGCIVFVALLCLVLSLVNQSTYKRGLYARYEEHIRDLLTFVQSQIDTDDLANCIKTGEKSPKYLELQKFMDTFKDNVKLQYLRSFSAAQSCGSHSASPSASCCSSRQSSCACPNATGLCIGRGRGYKMTRE